MLFALDDRCSAVWCTAMTCAPFTYRPAPRYSNKELTMNTAALRRLDIAARILMSILFLYSGVGKLMDPASVATRLTDFGFPVPMLMAYLVTAFELVAPIVSDRRIPSHDPQRASCRVYGVDGPNVSSVLVGRARPAGRPVDQLSEEPGHRRWLLVCRENRAGVSPVGRASRARSTEKRAVRSLSNASQARPRFD